MGRCTRCNHIAGIGEDVCSSCIIKQFNKNRSKTAPDFIKGKKRYIIFACTVLLFVTAQFIWTVNQPDRVVDAFFEAVREHDEAKLVQLMQSSDPLLTVEEKHGISIIDYFILHPEQLLLFEEKVHQEIESNDSNPLGIDYQFLSFQEDKNSRKLSTNYSFFIHPVDLIVKANSTDLTLLVDGVKANGVSLRNGTYRLGKFLPGSYEISAQLKTDALDQVYQETIYHFMSNEHTLDLNIPSLLMQESLSSDKEVSTEK